MSQTKKTTTGKKSTVAKNVAKNAATAAVTAEAEKTENAVGATATTEQSTATQSGDDKSKGDSAGDDATGGDDTSDNDGDTNTDDTSDTSDTNTGDDATGDDVGDATSTEDEGTTVIDNEEEPDELTSRLAKIQANEEFVSARNDILQFTKDMAGNVPQSVESLQRHQLRLYRALVRLLLEPADEDDAVNNLKYVVEIFRAHNKPGSCFSDALLMRAVKTVPPGNPARQDEFSNMLVMLLNLSRQGNKVSVDWDVFEARITRERGPALGQAMRRAFNIDVD